MDPLLHYFALRMSSTFVDSPQLARQRETLREHERKARSQRATRRRERIWQAATLLTAHRWRSARELGGRAG